MQTAAEKAVQQGRIPEIRQNRIRGFASAARYMFESPADAGLSNRSIGAVAPAAAFGKTASAVLPQQRGIT
jgi:hypothetical protein